MSFLELFDETLDINATENYELSVIANQSEISFCILDTLRNKFVMLRSYEPENDDLYDTSQMESIISKDDFLTRQYKKRNIISTSSKTTLVPESLFDETKKIDYFTFNFPYADDQKIISNKVDNQGLYIIFSLPEDYLELINVAFPGERVVHQLKPLIHNINYNRKPLFTNNIHVHLEKYYLHLIISDQNSLRFCNSFDYRTITDIQYYLIYVLKRLNISMEEIVFFSGKIIKKEEITNAFAGYLNNIRFVVPSGNYTLSYVLNDVELFRYANIFNVVNCG